MSKTWQTSNIHTEEYRRRVLAQGREAALRGDSREPPPAPTQSRYANPSAAASRHRALWLQGYDSAVKRDPPRTMCAADIGLPEG